jgi:hypothetical protein
MKFDFVKRSSYYGLCGLTGIYIDLLSLCEAAGNVFSQCAAFNLVIICHEATHYGMRCFDREESFSYLTPRHIVEGKDNYEGGYLCDDLLWGDCNKEIWRKPIVMFNAEKWNAEKHPMFTTDELKSIPINANNIKLSGLCAYLKKCSYL